jgi:hypothetical protein
VRVPDTVSLSTVQSNVAQLGQGFKQIEREIPLSSEDPSDPFRAMMTEFYEKKKEECDHLEADTKTMEARTIFIYLFLY